MNLQIPERRRCRASSSASRVHAVRYHGSSRHTPGSAAASSPSDKWKEAIDRMEGVGTEVPGGKKLAALLDYLERTHGPDSPAPAKK